MRRPSSLRQALERRAVYAISEIRQASLSRMSNVSTDKERVEYAKKQVPLLGIQILAALTEAQTKKYWDLLPGRIPASALMKHSPKDPCNGKPFIVAT